MRVELRHPQRELDVHEGGAGNAVDVEHRADECEEGRGELTRSKGAGEDLLVGRARGRSIEGQAVAGEGCAQMYKRDVMAIQSRWVRRTIEHHAEAPHVHLGPDVGIVADNFGGAVVRRADAAGDGLAGTPRRCESPIREHHGAVRAPKDVLELHITMDLQGEWREK